MMKAQVIMKPPAGKDKERVPHWSLQKEHSPPTTVCNPIKTFRLLTSTAVRFGTRVVLNHWVCGDLSQGSSQDAQD